MSLRGKRWLLAPLRQWRTCLLQARHGPGISYSTAWAVMTLKNSPNELPWVQQAMRETDADGEPGLHFDDWTALGSTEKKRRRRWLRRHGCSPFQLLGITDEALKSAGVHVVDWGVPPGKTARG